MQNVEKSPPSSALRVVDILQKLGLSKDDIISTPNFPMRIPSFWYDKIDFQDPYDPLLLQTLPSFEELEPSNWPLDAVGDLKSQKAKGLIHKYHGRALLITTGACQIHCRYCFRKHFPYEESPKTLQEFKEAFEYLRETPSIHEVILSGGDPLSLSPQRLSQIIEKIITISHIKTLRIHSRSLTVAPTLSTKNLLSALAQFPGNKVIVSHVNHPKELDQTTSQTFQLWRDYGWTILNQTVLLKGVNDNEETLIQLSHKLFEQGALPYYLNLLDRVQGTEHFLVPLKEAQLLHKAIQTKLSGYLVPKLVQEIQNEPYKTLKNLVSKS